MRIFSFIFILTITIAFPAYTCYADIIYLKNGDKLTGTIVNMENTKLIFWTEYAGEITLFWQDVDHFTMEDPSKIVLKEKPPTTEDDETLPEDKPAPSPEIIPDDVFAINPKPAVPVKITSRANTKLTNERGNTTKDYYYLTGEFIARTAQQRYIFDGKYEKEEKNNSLTEENWLAHCQISHFLDKKVYMYGDTLFENDKFKDLQIRSTYGLGAGYQFIESEQTNLSFSTGLSWVTETFYSADEKEFTAGQWGVLFDRYLYRNIVQLFHSDKGYISLKNSEDWFIKSKTGFRFPLYKGFTTTIQYEYDWDNEPASSDETEEDSKFMILIGYEFKN
jgi:putative salt-induced outer membrane protein YdiY